MSLQIKDANLKDCGILGLIHSESWKAAYRGIVPDSVLDNMSMEKSEKKFYNSFIHFLQNQYIQLTIPVLTIIILDNLQN